MEGGQEGGDGLGLELRLRTPHRPPPPRPLRSRNKILPNLLPVLPWPGLVPASATHVDSLRNRAAGLWGSLCPWMLRPTCPEGWSPQAGGGSSVQVRVVGGEP